MQCNGAEQSPWGRAIVPLELTSVLAQYASVQAAFSIRPAVGPFVDQEIRLEKSPLFLAEKYRLAPEVVALSESRRAESMWVRTMISDASERHVATMLLSHAFMKVSFPDCDKERSAAGTIRHCNDGGRSRPRSVSLPARPAPPAPPGRRRRRA